MKKIILINNVYSYRNRGDSAIVEAMATWFEANVCDAEIYLLSQDWEDNQEYYQRLGWHSAPMLWDIPMMSNKLVRLTTAGCNLLRAVGRLTFGSTRKSDHDTAWLYRNCHMVVDAGGGALYSSNRYTFYLGLYQHLANLYAGVLMGKTVVIAPQSIGPLYRKQDLWAVKWVLRRLKKVYVRERISEDLLRGLGVDCECVPDCAFLGGFVGEKSEELERHVETIGREEGIKVGLTVLSWKWACPRGLDQTEGMQRYLHRISDALREIGKKHRLKVYLYSHADVEHTVSDYQVSCEMAGILEEDGVNSEVVSADYTASDLHHLYGTMDLMVGSRMHSCILALMAGTPVVALAYQPKSSGVLELCGLGDFVLDAYTFETRALVDKMDRCLLDSHQLKATVLRNAFEQRRMAEAAFDRMASDAGR